jgi:hypothetical protein
VPTQAGRGSIEPRRFDDGMGKMMECRLPDNDKTL